MLAEFAQKAAYITIANTKGLLLENIFVFVPHEVQEKIPKRVLWKENTQITSIQNVKLIIDRKAMESTDRADK